MSFLIHRFKFFFTLGFILSLGVMSACSLQPPTTHQAPVVSVHPHPEPHQPLANSDYQLVATFENGLPNRTNNLRLILENPNGTAAIWQDFAVSHKSRMHVMTIDPSLSDYQHLHPMNQNPDDLAIINFPFTPRKAGEYIVFADVVPVKDHKERFISATFPVQGTPRAPHFATLSAGRMTASAETNELVIIADPSQRLVAGQMVMLHFTIKDKEGHLFRRLEPTMEAFAHLVAFSADRQTLAHMHPQGPAIVAENVRGGPNLMFHAHFPKPGYYRLFLQLQVNEQPVIVAFDAHVASE